MHASDVTMPTSFIYQIPSLLPGVYELFKMHLRTTTLADSPWTPIISGGCAGIAAWIPCYPQDVLKSRIQSSTTRMTMREAARNLHAQLGIRGFFKGFAPTMARAFPANAATFLGYEAVMSLVA